MKRFIVFALAAAFMCGSCYKDDSARGDFSQIDRRIYPLGGTTLTWFDSDEGEPPYIANFTPTLEMLKLADGEATYVEFTEEDYAKYDYRWRLARNPGRTVADTSKVTISTQRSIVDYPVEIGNGKDYRLFLELTEKETGMRYDLDYSVNVTNAFAGGLIIADTHDGGQTSDLSQLRAYPWVSIGDFTTFPEPYVPSLPQVIDDAYSWKNGAKIDGRVSSIMYAYDTRGDANRHIEFVVEGKHVVRLDGKFKEMLRDAALFTGGTLPATFNPQMVYALEFGGSYAKVILINDGNVCWYRSNYANPVMPYQYMQMDATPEVKVTPNVFNRSVLGSRHGMFFDETNGRMIGLPTGTSGATSTRWTAFADDQQGVFKVNELTGVNCLYVGVWSYGYNFDYGGDPNPLKMAYLMSDKITGKRSLYIFTGKNGGNTLFSGESIYDMSNCTDFDRSTVWANSYITNRNYWGNNNGNQPEFWYAVDNKIYAVTPTFGTTGGAPTAKLVFTFPEGENVTIMDWHKGFYQYGYMFSRWDNNGNPVWMTNGGQRSGMNQQMTVTTWDGTEGRVYAIPRLFPGTGQFLDPPATPENDVVFQQGGFGEITAIFHRQNY